MRQISHRLIKGLSMATCLSLGTVGAAHGVITSTEVLQSYLDRCNEGEGNACQALGAFFLDAEDARALGHRADMDKAMQFYERGCDLGDRGACSGQMRLLGDPDFSGYDPAAALPFYQARCARRRPDSPYCTGVTRLLADL